MMKQSFLMPHPTFDPVNGSDVLLSSDLEGNLVFTGTAAKGATVTLFFFDGTVMASGIETFDPGTSSENWKWRYHLSQSDRYRLAGDAYSDQVKLVTVQAHDFVRNIESPRIDHTFRVTAQFSGLNPPSLVNDTGEASHDGITNDGTLRLSGNNLEYQIDFGPFVPASANYPTVLIHEEGEHTITARAKNGAGNFDSYSYSFTLDRTPPSKPELTILPEEESSHSYTGIDWRIIEFSNRENATSWQWSTNQGLTWNHPQTPWADTIKLRSTLAFPENVMVKSIDRAGNESINSIALSNPVAGVNTVIPRPVLRLWYDSGFSGSDRVTKLGWVKVDGVSADNSWQWSTNAGATWKDPVDPQENLIKITEDGVHTVHVKVIDKSGNIAISSLDFQLDTVLYGPVIDWSSGKAHVNLKPSLDAESWLKTTVYHRDPNTGARGEVAVRQFGKPLTDYELLQELELPRAVIVSGLYRPGPDSYHPEINGLYTSVSKENVLALQHAFSDHFVANGKATLDISRPVFQRYANGETWYVWAIVGGDYIISRRNDSSEWYRQRSPSTTREAEFKNWEGLSLPLSKVNEEKNLNNGYSNHQRNLDSVKLETTGSEDPYAKRPLFGSPGEWDYLVMHEDLAGNEGMRYFGSNTRQTSFSPKPYSNVPQLRWDLDATTPDGQLHISRQVSTESLIDGVSFAPAIAPVQDAATYRIHISLSGSGLDLTNDKILIEEKPPAYYAGGKSWPLELSLEKSSAHSAVWIGGHISDLRYDSASRTIEMRSHLNPGHDLLDEKILTDMVGSIKLVNANGSPGERTISISSSGWDRLPSQIATATIDVSPSKLWVDLDPDTEDIQRSASHYLTNPAILAGGTAFLTGIEAPPTQDLYGLQVTFSGARLDTANHKIVLDRPLSLDASQALTKGVNIAGVKDLSYWYDAPSKTLTLTSGDPRRSLSGVQAKAIMESIKLVAPNALDGEWAAQFRLISNTDKIGADSTAKLVLDTVAPSLDLDYSVAGVQTTSQRAIGLTHARDGVSLFQKTIGAPLANDIDSIKLTLSSPKGSAKSDKLILDSDTHSKVSFGDKSAGAGQTLGGVAGMSFSFDSSGRDLVLRKQDGAALTGLETKAVLESIKFQTSSKMAGDRQVSITLTDQAGHTGTAKAILKLDTTAAPKISAELINSKQTSYQLLELGDILGKSNPHNLTKNEKVALPIPEGMSAEAFLSALRGISAEWGGLSITGNANTTYRPYKSFLEFDKPLRSGEQFTLQHQSAASVKGGQFSFSLSDDGKQLVLTNKGGFIAENTDIYEFAGSTAASRSNYDIGNIRLLYEVQTDNANTRPSVRIHYNGWEANVGDVIALHDKDRLLASKTLTAKDIGNDNASVILTPDLSLYQGERQIFSTYTETSGNSSRSNMIDIKIQQYGYMHSVSNATIESTQSMGAIRYADRDISYTNDALHPSHALVGAFWAPGHYESGPDLKVYAGRGDPLDEYLITVRMGGKLLGFDKVNCQSAHYHTIETAANILAPGTYDDLSVTATSITPGASNGQADSISGLTQSVFWAPQSLSGVAGGKGNDFIPIGRTKDGLSTMIQTGSGADSLILGSFGKKGDFSATVTDFTLGVDTVKVFGYPGSVDGEPAPRHYLHDINESNFNEFVKEVAPIQGGAGTKLVVDLDGAAAGNQTYTLHLQNVAYQPANTHTLFGV